MDKLANNRLLKHPKMTLYISWFAL